MNMTESKESTSTKQELTNKIYELTTLNDINTNEELKQKLYDYNYYLKGELPNILTNEEISDLERNKYTNKSFNASSVTENLKNTNLKRFICNLANKNDFVFEIPSEETILFKDGKSLNSSNYTISATIAGKDLSVSNLQNDCINFYASYCENVKKRLAEQYKDDKTVDINQLLADATKDECACYGDTIAYLSKKEPSKYEKLYGSRTALENVSGTNINCQLQRCRKGLYSPQEISDNCGSTVICTNSIDIGDNKMTQAELSIIGNMANNCSSSNTTAKETQEKITQKINENVSTTPSVSTPSASTSSTPSASTDTTKTDNNSDSSNSNSNSNQQSTEEKDNKKSSNKKTIIIIVIAIIIIIIIIALVYFFIIKKRNNNNSYRRFSRQEPISEMYPSSNTSTPAPATTVTPSIIIKTEPSTVSTPSTITETNAESSLSTNTTIPPTDNDTTRKLLNFFR